MLLSLDPCVVAANFTRTHSSSSFVASRQGILTVAAKRGLKVSTREARTIGKTRAKSPDDGDTMQS